MNKKSIMASGLFSAIVSGVALGAGLHNYPVGLLLGTSFGTATALVVNDQDAQNPHDSKDGDED